MSEEPLSLDDERAADNSPLIYALAALSGEDSTGEPVELLAAHSAGLWRSTDGGQTWQDGLENLGLTQTLPITSLAVVDQLAFAGAPGGVFRSTDHGKTWAAVLFPPPSPTVAALAASPAFTQDQTVFAATLEDGIFISRDSGLHWNTWNFGLFDLNVLCLAISPAFANDETLFAGTETGLFRSTNGGRAWRELEMPFGFEPVISLVVSPHYSQDHTVYMGTENKGLWVTRNEGDTWQATGAQEIVDPINALLVSEQGILAATADALWVSEDGGASWHNRLPQQFAEHEISAVLAPQGFGAGMRAWLGFQDGSCRVMTL